MSDATTDEGPNRVPGKWVLLTLVLLGIATVSVAVVTVRPIPGSKAAAAEDRAFGPAGAGEQRDIPLIQRKSSESSDGN